MKTKPTLQRATRGSLGPCKMVTFRLPLDIVAQLNSEANRRGVSKNQIVMAALTKEVSA